MQQTDVASFSLLFPCATSAFESEKSQLPPDKEHTSNLLLDVSLRKSVGRTLTSSQATASSFIRHNAAALHAIDSDGEVAVRRVSALEA